MSTPQDHEQHQVTYTVAPGDNLSEIGAEHGESWQQLYSGNQGVVGANPNLIYPGEKLTISEGSSDHPDLSAQQSQTEGSTSMTQPHQPSSFTEGLKPGDTYTSNTTHADGSTDTANVDLTNDGGYDENLNHTDAIGDSQVYNESSHHGETDYSLGNYDVNGHSDYQELDQHADGSADTYSSEGQHYGPGEFHSGLA